MIIFSLVTHFYGRNNCMWIYYSLSSSCNYSSEKEEWNFDRWGYKSCLWSPSFWAKGEFVN